MVLVSSWKFTVTASCSYGWYQCVLWSLPMPDKAMGRVAFTVNCIMFDHSRCWLSCGSCRWQSWAIVSRHPWAFGWSIREAVRGRQCSRDTWGSRWTSHRCIPQMIPIHSTLLTSSCSLVWWVIKHCKYFVVSASQLELICTKVRQHTTTQPRPSLTRHQPLAFPRRMQNQ